VYGKAIKLPAGGGRLRGFSLEEINGANRETLCKTICTCTHRQRRMRRETMMVALRKLRLQRSKPEYFTMTDYLSF
jgi:hypothetical protein